MIAFQIRRNVLEVVLSIVVALGFTGSALAQAQINAVVVFTASAEDAISNDLFYSGQFTGMEDYAQTIENRLNTGLALNNMSNIAEVDVVATVADIYDTTIQSEYDDIKEPGDIVDDISGARPSSASVTIGGMAVEQLRELHMADIIIVVTKSGVGGIGAANCSEPPVKCIGDPPSTTDHFVIAADIFAGHPSQSEVYGYVWLHELGHLVRAIHGDAELIISEGKHSVMADCGYPSCSHSDIFSQANMINIGTGLSDIAGYAEELFGGGGGSGGGGGGSSGLLSPTVIPDMVGCGYVAPGIFAYSWLIDWTGVPGASYYHVQVGVESGNVSLPPISANFYGMAGMPPPSFVGVQVQACNSVDGCGPPGYAVLWNYCGVE